MTTFLLQPTSSCVTRVGIDDLAAGMVASVLSVFPSGVRCWIEVWIANEKAAFAFTSGVGGDKVGSGNKVSDASTSEVKTTSPNSRLSRTRQNNKRVDILQKPKLLNGSPCQTLLHFN